MQERMWGLFAARLARKCELQGQRDPDWNKTEDDRGHSKPSLACTYMYTYIKTPHAHTHVQAHAPMYICAQYKRKRKDLGFQSMAC